MKKSDRGEDTIYRGRRRRIVDFAFDAHTARVFPDMIRRSVPGYETVVPLSGLIAAHYLRPGSRCYDLGCSLGATTLAVLESIGPAACEIIAVDNSAAMLERARERHAWDERVEFRHADLREVPIENASVVLMNYTLQFVEPAQRLDVLRRICSGLNRGGALLISEKLAGNDLFDELHEKWKRANGYTELEISQKRTALERVLVPDTMEKHLARLRAAGFDDVQVWHQCLNWASFLAIR